MPFGELERFAVVRSVVFAAHSLTGIGKSVHHIGKESEQLEKQRVDRQDDRSLPGASRGEEEVDCYQEECAQENVAVHDEEP